MTGQYNYCNENLAAFRLIREYEKHNNLVIAVDFDNTIYDFHSVGLELGDVISIVNRAIDADLEVFCFTANNNEQLVRSTWENFFQVSDVSINKSSLDHLFGGRKPFYSLLLDDRAGLGVSLQLLEVVLDYIEEKKKY